MDLGRLQDVAANMVYNICSIVTMPVEMALRPHYGSRYFPPIVMLFSIGMMLFLPAFDAVSEGFGRVMPFMPAPAPVGLFGIATFSKLFFLGLAAHNFRIWRRMIHMDREQNSLYEGPALFIFNIIPGTFWMVRILYEPIFLFVIALVLPNFFILQPSAAHFLEFAAIMLAMKNYAAWYMQWQFLRGVMDMRNAGPIIAKFVNNTATDEDLATIHLASLPKDIPEDIRRDTASHIVRAIIPGSTKEF
jgi:hypothetical protein